MYQSRFLLLVLSLFCAITITAVPQVPISKPSSPPPAERLSDDNVPTSMFNYSDNKLYRGYLSDEDISHVDNFTGNMTIHLPIINVPGNDGLAVKVTFNFDNEMEYALGINAENTARGAVPRNIY